MKYCYRITFVFIVALISSTYAQGPDTLWTKQLRWDYEDQGFAIQETVDSCYIGVGYIEMATYYQIYLFKLDQQGELLWEKYLGESYLQKGFDVKQTTDLGFVIVGTMQVLGDNQYMYLIKTDSLGDTLWSKTFGSGHINTGQSVQQLTDGGYIIAGSTRPFTGDMQVYLVRTAPSGDSLWTKTYGGPYDDSGWSVQQTPDQGFIVVGRKQTEPPSLDDDYYIIKTDAVGDTMWTRIYGDDTTQDRAYSVKHTSDNGYIIAGMGDFWNTWLVKTDSMGDTIWTKTYNPFGCSVEEVPNGGYIIGGWHGSDACLQRVDANGDSLWTRTYGTIDLDYANSVSLTSDGGYILIGKTFYQSPHGWPDVYVIKTAPDTLGIRASEVIHRKKDYHGSTILTGPLQFPTDKPFKIFDITGRQIYTINPTPGIYFIEVDGEIRQKVVKVR